MKKQEIGIVQMNYDNDGNITTATFTPSMVVEVSEEVRKELKNISASGPEALKENADTVLSSWFNKTNEIELADRDRYEIVSEIVKCSEYPNKHVKACTLRYFFQERQ